MDFGKFLRGFFGFPSRKRENFDDDCSNCPECYYPESCEEGMNSSPDTFFHDGQFFNIGLSVDSLSFFQQMQDVFRHVFSEFPSLEDPYDDHENHHGFFRNPCEKDPRNFFGDEGDYNERSEFPGIELFSEPRSPRDLVLKPSYKDSQHSIKSTHQQDSDLDDSLSNDVHGILKENSQQPRSGGLNLSFRKSMSIRTVQGRDGTIEEHRTVKDSSGNEVTTVRKSIGDQTYTVTLHKDKEGLTEKKEELINLDEKDVTQFQEKWSSMKDNIHFLPERDLFQESNDPNSLIQDAPGDPSYTSIFRKLFRL